MEEERPERPETSMPEPARRIAIAGFTASREDAPWGDPGWELWICNNLWKFSPGGWHRLYDLHDLKTIRGDVEHEAFLRGAPQKHADGSEIKLADRPVYCFDPQAEWPAAVRFPKDEITDALGRYFTNSISWMVAHALLEMVASADEFAREKLAEFELVAGDDAAEYHRMAAPGLEEALKRDYLGRCELHVYGVDMATGSEYSSQRPSVEYHLGIASGMGIKIHIPLQSDLLKLSAMYGTEDDSPLAAKIAERERELVERGRALEAQLQQTQTALAQIQGALETTRYFGAVWTNPRAARDGSPKGLEDGKTDLKPQETEAVLERAA